MPSSFLCVSLLMVAAFSFATRLELWRQEWTRRGEPTSGLAQVIFGDSQRLLANHFFVKADVYFHSGYYPTIFDAQKPGETTHLSQEAATSEHAGHDDDHGKPGHHTEHAETTADFLGEPKDWIDAFGRCFFPSRHSHLEKLGEEREILPWLRISAELDPHRVETYIVAAYWLRTRLERTDEAEKFLREGWRANRDSFEILFELGRLYLESRNDPFRARNIWELALQKWEQQEAAKADPDRLSYLQVTGHLARLEEREGNLAKAILYLQMMQKFSPSRGELQTQIDELSRKTNAK